MAKQIALYLEGSKLKRLLDYVNAKAENRRDQKFYEWLQKQCGEIVNVK